MKLFLISLIVTLVSCKTYTIPIKTFESEFKNVNKNSFREVYVKNPIGNVHKQLANPLDFISCIDKQGMEVSLVNSPSLEFRFTHKNEKRTILYFDTVYLENDSICGMRSRIMNFPSCFSINNVSKIEIQDGGKDFKYVRR